jgi:hypothetical protein
MGEQGQRERGHLGREGGTIIGDYYPVLGEQSLLENNLKIRFVPWFIGIDENDIKCPAQGLESFCCRALDEFDAVGDFVFSKCVEGNCDHFGVYVQCDDLDVRTRGTEMK